MNKVDSNKIKVVYEGIDDKLRNTRREARSNLKNTKYFLYVGNAYPHKNLNRLLDAFNILVSQYPDISLICVGRPDYFYKRLKEKVGKMNLEKSVSFLEDVSDEELGSLYKNAQALILPSLMEGFGLPAIEAMANKCLVLASDIPALREVCGDAAIYFNPKNIEDISEKMKNVCSNDKYHYSDKIITGLEREKTFFWEKMAKQTLETYESSVGL